MHEYEIKVLYALKTLKGKSDIRTLAEKTNLVQDKVMWATENLRSAGLVEVSRNTKEKYTKTAEGRTYAKALPEQVLLKKALKGKIKLSENKDQIGLSWAKRNGWIDIKDGYASITEEGERAAKENYIQKEALDRIESGESLSNEEKNAVKMLIQRGLVNELKVDSDVTVNLTEKGLKSNTTEEGIGQITRSIIVNGEWKKAKIRPYDVNSPYEHAYPARLHPMHEFIDIIRSSWLKMGFVEVSGPIIESAFWNFDALFSPQDHPTREMQDTFFLSNPKSLDIDDVELLDRVGKMQTKNWKATFNEELSKQALLRTHTTSVSVRNIHKFANLMEENYPLKLFSVGKVFRNETIDYKHLAELHQIDGVIIGNNLNLSNLMHTLRTFYEQLGMRVKFKPSYFPFVEPGMEIGHYNEKLGEEIEMGGSGIIRSEITKAMGTNKTVLAWGLAVDRPIMDFLKIDTLMDLYKNDLKWLRNREGLEV